MREIKFRAWDKENEQMHENIEETDSDPDFVLYDSNGCAVELQPETFLYYLTSEQFEVMQYTGLKDKNGREIYEGDILKISESGRWGGVYLAPVEWIDWNDEGVVGGSKGEHWAFYGIACMRAKEIKCHEEANTIFTVGFALREYGSCLPIAEMTRDVDRFEIEVVGNIFENPELLEG